MLFNLGLLSLFFLPVIESFSREAGLFFLCLGAILLALNPQQSKKTQLDFSDLLWFILLVVFSLSLLYTASYIRSFSEFLRYLSYFLILVTIKNYHNQPSLLKSFYLPMIVVNSIILSLFSWWYLIPVVHYYTPPSLNLYFANYGHNRLSAILIFALPVSIILSILNTQVKYLYKLLAVFLFITLISTVARGAFLELSFSSLILLLLYFKTNKIDAQTPERRRLTSYVSFFSLITMIFLVFNFIYSNFFNPLLLPFNIRNTYKPVMGELRFEYIRQAASEFARHPLRGTGLDTFVYVSRINQLRGSQSSDYVHNQFLEIFMETGIFGGIIFAVLMCYLLIKSYCHIKKLQGSDKIYHMAIMIGLLASYFSSLIDYDWQYISIFFILFLGLILTSDNVDQPKYDIHQNGWRIFIFLYFLVFLVKFILIKNIPEYSGKIDRLMQKNELAAAENLALRFHKLDQGGQPAIVRLIEISQKSGSAEKIHYWNEQLIKTSPYDQDYTRREDFRLFLTDMQKKVVLGNTNDALSIFKIIKSKYPDLYQQINSDAYLNKINLALNNNNHSEAMEIFQTYIISGMNIY